MNYLRISCAALALGLATQTLFAANEPKDEKMVPASPTLTDEGKEAIMKMFPDATIGDAKLNIDRGIEAWFVQITGVTGVSSVEVSAGSAQINAPVMVMQSDLKLEKKDLPDAVIKAANTAAGVSNTVPILGDIPPVGTIYKFTKFVSADKLQIFCDFTPKNYDSEGGNYKLIPLSGPVTVYDVTYVKPDGTKGVVRVDPDGKVINPMNWMAHAAAVVPKGKLVIRANLGCVIDYTDMSGTVWSADRNYPKKGAQPAPGEITWGGLGGEPHGGRQHSRINLVIQGTDAPFIYDSERDKEGQFQFDVPNGLYTVRIHLCETWPDGAKPPFRLFAIKIQGKQVADKLNIADKAGGLMKPYVLEYKDVQVTDGKLMIEPYGQGNDRHATIEAYEVIQQ